jgi:hypothetical protein
MKNLWRNVAVVALLGSGLVLLAQAPVQAQYRRPMIGPVFPPILPPAPRALVATPPPILPYTYSNPLLLQQSINLNRLAATNAYYQNQTLLLQSQLYNPLFNPLTSPYRSPYLTPGYSTYPYVTPNYLYTAGVINPGLPYNPYNVYNPYFAAFGFRP